MAARNQVNYWEYDRDSRHCLPEDVREKFNRDCLPHNSLSWACYILKNCSWELVPNSITWDKDGNYKQALFKKMFHIKEAVDAVDKTEERCELCKNYWTRKSMCSPKNRVWMHPETCKPPWCPGFEKEKDTLEDG